MTHEEIERDRAPERIWIDAERTYSATSFSAGIKYIRADLHDAEVQRLTAERDAALAGAMRVRKLVWTGGWHGRRSGVYTILPNYGKGPKRFMLSHGSNIIGWFDGEEEAQAAAQSDHEARVRAALEPAAPSVSAAAKVLLATKTVRALIAAGKRIDAEELLSALAIKENSDE